MERKGMFSRFFSLFRGLFGTRLAEAEANNASAVYEQAIVERTRHYDELRQAAARLVYLRHKTEAERDQCERDRSFVDAALARAAQTSDDQKALLLLRKRRELDEILGRQSSDLERLAAQADAAKDSLDKLSQALADLKRERVEMLARKAHAEAQHRAQAAFASALQGGSGADQALENVRGAIARLEVEVGLERQEDGDISMAQLRREHALQGDRQALLELKQALALPSPRATVNLEEKNAPATSTAAQA